jgi:hypothetical protein
VGVVFDIASDDRVLDDGFIAFQRSLVDHLLDATATACDVGGSAEDTEPLARVSTSMKQRSIDNKPALGRNTDEPCLFFIAAGLVMKSSFGCCKSASKGTPQPPQKITSPVNK